MPHLLFKCGEASYDVGLFQFYCTWKFENCRNFALHSNERFAYKNAPAWLHNFQTYLDFFDRSRSLNKKEIFIALRCPHACDVTAFHGVARSYIHFNLMKCNDAVTCGTDVIDISTPQRNCGVVYGPFLSITVVNAPCEYNIFAMRSFWGSYML